MQLTSQNCLVCTLVLLSAISASALSVDPTLGRPPADDSLDLLGDCMSLVQVGSPRRAAASMAAEAAVLEEELKEASLHAQPPAGAAAAPAKLEGDGGAGAVKAQPPAGAVAPAKFEGINMELPHKQPLAEASAGDGFLAAEVAWTTVARAGQAKHLAALSMAVGLLIVALRFRLSRLRVQGQGEDGIKAALDTAAEVPSEVRQEAEAEPPLPPAELAEMPPPMRRLRCIGASYVVPRERIERCTSETLSFNIPTLPSVWPLRALLVRSSPAHPWAQLHVTVDIVAASGLPPLLTCTRTDALARPEESGGTGGTGSPTNEAEPGLRFDPWERPHPDNAEEAEEDEDCPWLKICNAGGTVVATIRRRRDGSCLIQHQDRSHLEMAMNLDGVAPGITISKQGEEVSQATSLSRGREENMQVDTQPDVQSPESCILLICTIAALAFQP